MTFKRKRSDLFVNFIHFSEPAKDALLALLEIVCTISQRHILIHVFKINVNLDHFLPSWSRSLKNLSEVFDAHGLHRAMVDDFIFGWYTSTTYSVLLDTSWSEFPILEWGLSTQKDESADFCGMSCKLGFGTRLDDTSGRIRKDTDREPDTWAGYRCWPFR